MLSLKPCSPSDSYCGLKSHITGAMSWEAASTESKDEIIRQCEKGVRLFNMSAPTGLARLVKIVHGVLSGPEALRLPGGMLHDWLADCALWPSIKL